MRVAVERIRTPYRNLTGVRITKGGVQGVWRVHLEGFLEPTGAAIGQQDKGSWISPGGPLDSGVRTLKGVMARARGDP